MYCPKCGSNDISERFSLMSITIRCKNCGKEIVKDLSRTFVLGISSYPDFEIAEREFMEEKK